MQQAGLLTSVMLCVCFCCLELHLLNTQYTSGLHNKHSAAILANDHKALPFSFIRLKRQANTSVSSNSTTATQAAELSTATTISTAVPIATPASTATPIVTNTTKTFPIATNVSTAPIATNVSTAPIATNVSTTPLATNVSTAPLATNVSTTPLATNVSTAPLATNVSTASIATNTTKVFPIATITFKSLVPTNNSSTATQGGDKGAPNYQAFTMVFNIKATPLFNQSLLQLKLAEAFKEKDEEKRNVTVEIIHVVCLANCNRPKRSVNDVKAVSSVTEDESSRVEFVVRENEKYLDAKQVEAVFSKYSLPQLSADLSPNVQALSLPLPITKHDVTPPIPITPAPARKVLIADWLIFLIIFCSILLILFFVWLVYSCHTGKIRVGGSSYFAREVDVEKEELNETQPISYPFEIIKKGEENSNKNNNRPSPDLPKLLDRSTSYDPDPPLKRQNPIYQENAIVNNRNKRPSLESLKKSKRKDKILPQKLQPPAIVETPPSPTPSETFSRSSIKQTWRSDDGPETQPKKPSAPVRTDTAVSTSDKPFPILQPLQEFSDNKYNNQYYEDYNEYNNQYYEDSNKYNNVYIPYNNNYPYPNSYDNFAYNNDFNPPFTFDPYTGQSLQQNFFPNSPQTSTPHLIQKTINQQANNNPNIQYNQTQQQPYINTSPSNQQTPSDQPSPSSITDDPPFSPYKQETRQDSPKSSSSEKEKIRRMAKDIVEDAFNDSGFLTDSNKMDPATTTDDDDRTTMEQFRKLMNQAFESARKKNNQ